MSKSHPQENSHTEPLPDYEIEAAPTFREKMRVRLRDWRLWLVAALLGFVVLAVWQGPSLYREAKIRHALGLIAQGEAAIETGDMTAASVLFRRATLMAPGDSRVTEKIDLQNASFGNSAALAGLQRKIDDKTAVPGEAIVVAEQAVRNGDSTSATRALDALPNPLEPALEGRRVGVVVRLFLLQGKPAESLKYARDAGNRLAGPEGDQARLLEAELLLKSVPPREGEANELLRPLAAKPTKEGAGALRLLAQYRTRHPQSAVLGGEEIAALLKKHPGKSSPADDLLLADLRLAERPEERSAIFSALVEEQKTRPLEERILCCRWLIAKKAYREADALITADDVANSTDALFVRMDALSGQNLWRESRALLEGAGNGGLPDVLKHLFLSRIAEELGNASEAVDEWEVVQSGLRLADPASIRFVAQYAEARHRSREAAFAFRLLADHSETRAKACSALCGLCRQAPRPPNRSKSTANCSRSLLPSLTPAAGWPTSRCFPAAISRIPGKRRWTSCAKSPTRWHFRASLRWPNCGFITPPPR